MEKMVRLSRSAARVYTVKLLREQGGICPLCKKKIDINLPKEGVLDHSHDTGRIRGVLHRSCNSAEGKIANAVGHWGCKSMKYENILEYLKNLVIYLETEPKNVLYYAHKTAAEKVVADKVRAKKQRALRQAKKTIAEKGTD